MVFCLLQYFWLFFPHIPLSVVVDGQTGAMFTEWQCFSQKPETIQQIPKQINTPIQLFIQDMTLKKKKTVYPTASALALLLELTIDTMSEAPHT